MEEGITDFDCDFFIFIYINSVTPFYKPFFYRTTKHDHCSAVYPSIIFVGRKMIRGILLLFLELQYLHRTRQLLQPFPPTIQFIVAWVSFS